MIRRNPVLIPSFYWALLSEHGTGWYIVRSSIGVIPAVHQAVERQGFPLCRFLHRDRKPAAMDICPGCYRSQVESRIENIKTWFATFGGFDMPRLVFSLLQVFELQFSWRGLLLLVCFLLPLCRIPSPFYMRLFQKFSFERGSSC
jgi:hypothetical protein